MAARGWSVLALGLAGCWALSAQEYPEAAISNGIVDACLHLPDPERGSYRGTRFDWSGIIYSLRYQGHEYFGRWYERHDPQIHDAITGPVEEYRSEDGGLGYAEAPAGGTFVRIGVGVVRKPEDQKPFQPFHTYEIVDPGKWTVRRGAEWIEFTHNLTAPDGYAYEYRKMLRLVRGKPQLLLEHRLRNTGRRVIETAQYNHNFFVIDNEVVGPGIVVRFPFEPKPVRDFEGRAEVHGREVRYPRELQKGESAFTELTGFGATPDDYRIQIENHTSGAGVAISGDRPINKIVYWSIRSTACPEPYIQLRIEPGKQTEWTIRYDFYTLSPRASR